jgi:hypothetical protein
MPAELTEQEFSKHLNTKFALSLEDQKIDLELVQVKGYLPQQIEEQGMERFSLFFDGPGIYLPQKVYSVQHEQMGEFDIFLVPISGDDKGFRYEAVFNYYKT